MLLKYFSIFSLFSLLMLYTACAPNLSNKIVGTWNMQQVYDNSNDVSAQHNPEKDRWIKFSKDGSFKSGGQPYGQNEGKWVYDEANNVLYLDSDEGEGDDSYWNLQIQKKEMVWSGTRSSFTERFRISFRKS